MPHNQRQRGRGRRQGAAPIEFVMQMPFLLALAAMITTVGFSALGKFTAAAKARREVWKLRDNLQGNADLDVKTTTADTPLGSGLNLSISGSDGDYSGNDQSAGDAGGFELFNPELGSAYGEATDEVPIFPWLGGDRTARSRAAVLATSWDHKDLPEFKREGPHLQPLERAATGTTVITPVLEKIVQLLLGNIKDAFGTLDGDFQDDLAGAQSEQDKAQEEANKAKEEAAKEKQKLQDEIDKKKKEKKDLEDQKKELEDQKKAKEELIEELEEQDPPPQDQIDDLNDEIDQIDEDIDKKQDEIDDKQEEINELEDKMDEVDAKQKELDDKLEEEKNKAQNS